MWNTAGYKNQKLFLENALAHDKLAHAYLFFGPERENKRKLALEFAEKILGAEGAKINPDLIVLDQDKMKIEDIRNLISELSLKPYQYERKVAVIDGFENVTAEGANSILKTLEEPNASTIIILLAQNKQMLLPTIISRCQTLYFNRQQATAAGDAQKDLAELVAQPAVLRLAAIKAYAEKETPELAKIFEDWLDFEHQDFLSGHPEKFVNLQALIESISGLKQNLNRKLILERLFLNLA